MTVLWPAPTKFDDGAGGHSMGYHNQVVLPLRIVAKNADKPVTLRADISYAVCDKLCIPVEANAELAFTSVASTEDGALSAALDTVPKPANVGDPNPLTIRDVKREGKSTVLVDVAAPDAKEVSLFVEGPTPDWGLPVPNLLEHGPPGVKRFAFELDGLPPGAKPEGRRAQADAGRRRPRLRVQYQSGLGLDVVAANAGIVDGGFRRRRRAAFHANKCR